MSLFCSKSEVVLRNSYAYFLNKAVCKAAGKNTRMGKLRIIAKSSGILLSLFKNRKMVVGLLWVKIAENMTWPGISLSSNTRNNTLSNH
jgi:hypothetical protein